MESIATKRRSDHSCINHHTFARFFFIRNPEEPPFFIPPSRAQIACVSPADGCAFTCDCSKVVRLGRGLEGKSKNEQRYYLTTNLCLSNVEIPPAASRKEATASLESGHRKHSISIFDRLGNQARPIDRSMETETLSIRV